MIIHRRKDFRSSWGSLEYYDKRNDRITTKMEKKLMMVNRLIHKITTTKDPVIRQVGMSNNRSDIKIDV